MPTLVLVIGLIQVAERSRSLSMLAFWEIAGGFLSGTGQLEGKPLFVNKNHETSAFNFQPLTPNFLSFAMVQRGDAV